MFLALDIIFAIVNTIIGYKLLAKHFTNIQFTVKLVLLAFHLAIWAHVAGSAMVLPLIFEHRNDPEDAQVFIGFTFGRVIDMNLLNFMLVFFYKLMFTLKRTQIQMNERNRTTKQTIVALQRFICIERFILICYLVYFAYDAYRLFNLIRSNKSVSRVIDREFLGFIAQTILNLCTFGIQLMTLLYFLAMATRYVTVFKWNFNMTTWKFTSAINLLFLWMVVTLSRYSVFYFFSVNVYLTHGKNIAILD